MIFFFISGEEGNKDNVQTQCGDPRKVNLLYFYLIRFHITQTEPLHYLWFSFEWFDLIERLFEEQAYRVLWIWALHLITFTIGHCCIIISQSFITKLHIILSYCFYELFFIFLLALNTTIPHMCLHHNISTKKISCLTNSQILFRISNHVAIGT